MNMLNAETVRWAELKGVKLLRNVCPQAKKCFRCGRDNPSEELGRECIPSVLVQKSGEDWSVDFAE